MGIPATVLLCADRPDRRLLLVTVLEHEGLLTVVGRMSVTQDAAEVAAARHPEVVVVDSLDFPAEGARLVARLREMAPGAAIVAVSPGPARPASLLARPLSADRYLHPEDGLEALRAAVLVLVQGAEAAAEGTA
jgi:DNA-binding NarL/FixJ family response regulator